MTLLNLKNTGAPGSIACITTVKLADKHFMRIQSEAMNSIISHPLSIYLKLLTRRPYVNYLRNLTKSSKPVCSSGFARYHR